MRFSLFRLAKGSFFNLGKLAFSGLNLGLLTYQNTIFVVSYFVLFAKLVKELYRYVGEPPKGARTPTKRKTDISMNFGIAKVCKYFHIIVKKMLRKC